MATSIENGALVMRCDECGGVIEFAGDAVSLTWNERPERAKWRPGKEHFVPVIENLYPGTFHLACADAARPRLEQERWTREALAARP